MQPVTKTFACLLLLLISMAQSRAESPTSLIIEGGGLQPNSPALLRLVAAATVNGRLRIGYLATASENPALSQSRFILRIGTYGVRPDQIQIIDINVDNAAEQAENPDVVRQIADCTAIFFGGGDQTRITRALRKPNGEPTAALQEIYAHWKRGEVIFGTSAGAAVQSEKMITASGLPSGFIDEGMDALDFGLTKASHQPARRGLLVSRGLGFLRSGIVDQHFNQHRGRLARLARAAIEEETRFGFGIDENAALAVLADGTLEVLGPGPVLIVDAAGAKCQDGPLGCSITGAHLTCLEHGDRFDPGTGQATVHPTKRLIEPSQENNNGNFLIADIAGRGAVLSALRTGLANNASREQAGITIKYHQHYAHGYRFQFSKTEQTRSYEATDVGYRDTTVTNVRLDIEPVAVTLRRPGTAVSKDVVGRPLRGLLEAVSFRGILLADDQGLLRPQAAITRAELAVALAHAIRLVPPRGPSVVLTDVPVSLAGAPEIRLVVGTGLMSASEGLFRPAEPITRQEAAGVLVRFAERYLSRTLPSEPVELKDIARINDEFRAALYAAHREQLLLAKDGEIRPQESLLREEAAAAIYQVLDFPWARSP